MGQERNGHEAGKECGEKRGDDRDRKVWLQANWCVDIVKGREPES